MWIVLGTENTLAVGERGKGSGDGCWTLVGKNGIGGGGKELAAKRESAAGRERVVTVLSSSSLRPNSESSFASNSSSSSQLSSHRCGVDNVGFRGELFRVSTSKSSSQFSVCSAAVCWFVSGKSQSSIALLAIEKVRPLVVEEEQR